MSGPPPTPLGITFVRWRLGGERVVTFFPPMSVDHPMAGSPCLVCGRNLFGGIDADPPPDLVLMAVGVQPEDLAEKGNGVSRWYNAVALALHAACAVPGYVPGSLAMPEHEEG